ncbi:MAG: hypothetical protein KDA79_16505 [Planctomycetaceae bacterium]|nr:hypothetical protein [Planctomycetaceae bacterium]
MRRPTTRLFIFLAAVFVLSVRVAWQLVMSPSGMEPHLTSWRNMAGAAVPGIGWPARPLTDREPSDQARFWLREVEGIDETRADSQLALGAAWVLDSPSNGYLQHNIRRVKHEFARWLPTWTSFELNYEAIAAGEAQFEAVCREQCREQIEKALRLQPDDVNLRRHFALLLFQGRTLTVGLRPRWNEWRNLLDEASRHDPDNALYDYLAAAWLWEKAVTYERLDGITIDGLTVHDANWLEEANTRMQAGLARRDLQFGTGNGPAILSFLEQSSLPRSQYPAVFESRRNRANSLLLALLRLHSHEISLQIHRREFTPARQTARDLLHLDEQLTREGNGPSAIHEKAFLREYALGRSIAVNEADPEFPAGELVRLRKEREAAKLERLVLAEAVTSLIEDYPRDEESWNFNRGGNARNFGAAITQPVAGWMMLAAVGVAMLLLCLQLVLWSLWPAFRRAGPVVKGLPPSSWYWQTVAWILGPLISFVVLGLCPVELIPRSLQATGLKLLVLLAAVVLAGYALRWLLRRLQVPGGQALALMAASTLATVAVLKPSQSVDLIRDALAGWPLAALLAALACLLIASCAGGWQIARFARNNHPSVRRQIAVAAILLALPSCLVSVQIQLDAPMSQLFDKVVPVPFAIWPEAAAISPTVNELKQMSDSPAALWTLAGIEWVVYRGPVWGAVLAVLIVLLPLPGRISGRTKTSPRQDGSGLPRRIRQRWSIANRSCGVAGMLFLSLCLTATPTVMQQASRRLEQQIDWWRRSAPTAGELNQALADVRADENLMSRLRTEAGASP